MRTLGITTVFDLRSDPEMQKYSTPIPTIEGVHILRAPVFANEDYSPESMARWVGVGDATFFAYPCSVENLSCMQAVLRRYSGNYHS
jgi:hypothetical protein